MILKKIKLTQFLSHSDTVLELRDDQKVLLDGASGSGKSSIIEALIWCLYGRGRVDNRSLVKAGTLFAEGLVTLQGEDGREYNIKRKVSSQGKQEVQVASKEAGKDSFSPIPASGVKEVQAYIEKEILHASYMLFINSIVYPQENMESFVKQSAAGRKDILLEIVNASDYDNLYDKVKSKVSAISFEIGNDESKLNFMEASIATDEIAAKRLTSLEGMKQEKTTSLAVKTEELKVEYEKHSQGEKIRSEAFNVMDKIRFFEARQAHEKVLLSGLKKKWEEVSSFNLNEKKAELLECQEGLKEKEKGLAACNLWNEKMMEVVRLSPVDEDFAGKRAEINKQAMILMKKDIESCPELHKPCPMIVKERDLRVRELDETLAKLDKDERIYRKKKQVYEDTLNALGDKPVLDSVSIDGLRYKISKLEQSIYEHDTLRIQLVNDMVKKEDEKIEVEKGLSELRVELAALQKEAEIFIDNSSSLTRLGIEIGALNRGLAELEGELSLARAAQARLDSNKQEMELVKQHITDIKKQIEDLELLKEAFGNKGIKAMVIDYILPRLEDKINEILSKLSDFRVVIDTQKKGVKEETTIEGLFIDIINDGGELLSYDSYSGGEKMKINMAIFEALASLSKMNFRVFDETFVALDQESGDKFLEVLEEIQNGISQMICVSHMPSIKDFFAEKVLVMKKNGDSFISNQ